jgi:hypothetical protein
MNNESGMDTVGSALAADLVYSPLRLMVAKAMNDGLLAVSNCCQYKRLIINLIADR